MAVFSTNRIVALGADADGGGVEQALTDWTGGGDAPRTLLVRHRPGEGPAGKQVLDALGEFLRRAAQEGVRAQPAALALPADVDRPEEMALEAAAACPHAPKVHLMLPALALEAIQRSGTLELDSGGAACARRWWEGLLALAAVSPTVSLVPAVAGPGLSLLAAGSTWTGPTPGLAELVPSASMRLRLDLDFAQLLDGVGDAPGELARLAASIVARADRRLGPGPGPRRLALNLEGLGRAVVARGRDPGTFDALRWLGLRLRAFRDGARAASVALARRLGATGGVTPFPVPQAFEVADRGLLDRAVLTHGARHSHLVCISPWSLAAPELGRAGLSLLPALKWADSIAWCRPTEAPRAYGQALRFAWAQARAG